ncbi:hypothetical protein [Hyphomonas sp.]
MKLARRFRVRGTLSAHWGREILIQAAEPKSAARVECAVPAGGKDPRS